LSYGKNRKTKDKFILFLAGSNLPSRLFFLQEPAVANLLRRSLLKKK